MSKIPLYLCDRKLDCNDPCYRYCRLIMDYAIVRANCRPNFCPMEEFEEPYREIGDLTELKAQCSVPTLDI